jgi:hypothetical protein
LDLSKESPGFMYNIPATGFKTVVYKHKLAAARTPTPKVESKEGNTIISGDISACSFS